MAKERKIIDTCAQDVVILETCVAASVYEVLQGSIKFYENYFHVDSEFLCRCRHGTSGRNFSVFRLNPESRSIYLRILRDAIFM